MGVGGLAHHDQLNVTIRHWDGLAHAPHVATSTPEMTRQIRAGLNCLVGPGDRYYDASAGNPCEGMEKKDAAGGVLVPLGIIPALERRVTAKDPYAEKALAIALLAKEVALASLSETYPREIQRLARVVSLLAQAALSMYP
jgi:hypothetical protein